MCLTHRLVRTARTWTWWHERFLVHLHFPCSCTWRLIAFLCQSPQAEAVWPLRSVWSWWEPAVEGRSTLSSRPSTLDAWRSGVHQPTGSLSRSWWPTAQHVVGITLLLPHRWVGPTAPLGAEWHLQQWVLRRTYRSEMLGTISTVQWCTILWTVCWIDCSDNIPVSQVIKQRKMWPSHRRSHVTHGRVNTWSVMCLPCRCPNSDDRLWK